MHRPAENNSPATLQEQDNSQRLYKIALRLAMFTIIYNIIEGLVATFFGYKDESLTLFGFGVDSFIEAVSGFGIAHMVLRIRNHPESSRDSFEKTALRITGISFYLLTTGLAVGSVRDFLGNHKPETTIAGVIISAISILVMIWLFYNKMRVGKKLCSDAVIADAGCTKVCIYMSLILLASSAVYEFTGIAYADIIGSLGIAYFSFKEGRECFQKVKQDKYCEC